MLKGQKKGQSKYPMRLICEKCGKYYIIRKHRRSKVCQACAYRASEEYFQKRGEQFVRWFKGVKRYVEETEKLLKERGEL